MFMHRDSVGWLQTGLELFPDLIPLFQKNKKDRCKMQRSHCDPNGIRTRATAVKGRGPRPLDDGGLSVEDSE